MAGVGTAHYFAAYSWADNWRVAAIIEDIVKQAKTPRFIREAAEWVTQETKQRLTQKELRAAMDENHE
jgi:uncharacterized protein (UPF0147 family)